MGFLKSRRTPHGVRGLKSPRPWPMVSPLYRRTPHGVRGLKCPRLYSHSRRGSSHPSRGAWIEIRRLPQRLHPSASHPSRGAWIEISLSRPKKRTLTVSHPSRGAWIEIACVHPALPSASSHPSRGAWIEIPDHLPAVPAWSCSRTPHGVRGLKCRRMPAI